MTKTEMGHTLRVTGGSSSAPKLFKPIKKAMLMKVIVALNGFESIYKSGLLPKI